MYYYPGKTKTYSRVFNRISLSILKMRQLDLFGSDFLSAGQERSEASTSAADKKLYVLVTRKVSLTSEKNAQILSNFQSLIPGLENA